LLLTLSFPRIMQGSPSFQAAQSHHGTANQNKKQRAAESLRADHPLNLRRDTFAAGRIQGKSAPPRFSPELGQSQTIQQGQCRMNKSWLRTDR